MRKIAIILAVVMLLTAIAIPAFAAEPRATTIVPSLSFEGTTATCALRAIGNNTSEHLEATIRLYRGNTLIATWTAEGNGYIFFSQTKAVTAGYTYTMTADVTIDGDACPTATVSEDL